MQNATHGLLERASERGLQGEHDVRRCRREGCAARCTNESNSARPKRARVGKAATVGHSSEEAGLEWPVKCCLWLSGSSGRAMLCKVRRGRREEGSLRCEGNTREGHVCVVNAYGGLTISSIETARENRKGACQWGVKVQSCSMRFSAHSPSRPPHGPFAQRLDTDRDFRSA